MRCISRWAIWFVINQLDYDYKMKGVSQTIFDFCRIALPWRDFAVEMLLTTMS